MHKTVPALIVLTVVMFVATVGAGQDRARDTSTVRQVMETMTIPASDVVFTAASDPPTDAKGWQDARKNAVLLAESGTVLLTAGLARDNTTWVEMVRAMVTQTNLALKTIDAKDVKTLEQVANDLYVTCDTCHKRYLDQ